MADYIDVTIRIVDGDPEKEADNIRRLIWGSYERVTPQRGKKCKGEADIICWKKKGVTITRGSAWEDRRY